jgi:prepilin-type N-terminal cleavage/methylation domain-containing protein
VTLIEVMVVVVILGILSGAVALAVFPQLLKAKIRATRMNARVLRNAAGAWRSERPSDDCPTPDMLRDAQLIDEGKLTDAWETPYRIVCRDAHTVVISLGPDRKESDDDLVEPEPVAMAP